MLVFKMQCSFDPLESVYLSRESWARGKKYLLSIGFIPCNNPSYFTRGNEFVHYNHSNKNWYFDFLPSAKEFTLNF